jgi:hypothetical protein
MKKILSTIIIFLMVVFLASPVNATPLFTKTPAYPEDLDYQNTLVDYNGYNVDFEVIWSKLSGLAPLYADFTCYKNGAYQFGSSTWEQIDIGKYRLSLTQSQKDIVKNILFSRLYEYNSYCQILGQNPTGTFVLETQVNFKTLLNVNLHSVYLADKYTASSSNVVTNFYKTINVYDKQDILIASILLDEKATQPFDQVQNAVYVFSNKYTAVQKIQLAYGMTIEPIYEDEYAYFTIHQIGLFATIQTILPNLDIDTDFQIFTPTLCGVAGLGCELKNLIGEFSNTIYKQLGAEGIALGIMNIYDVIFYPVYIIADPAWQSSILLMYAILTVGLILLIVKRVVG